MRGGGRYLLRGKHTARRGLRKLSTEMKKKKKKNAFPFLLSFLFNELLSTWVMAKKWTNISQAAHLHDWHRITVFLPLFFCAIMRNPSLMLFARIIEKKNKNLSWSPTTFAKNRCVSWPERPDSICQRLIVIRVFFCLSCFARPTFFEINQQLFGQTRCCTGCVTITL